MASRIAIFNRPHRGYLRALVAVCLLVLLGGLIATGRDAYLEPYDAANYVEVARNLLAGRGLSSQVVGNFYRQYPEVAHPADRRPSAWSLVLAASVGLLGESPFAATLPNLLLGLLVGPLLVYALARRLRLAPAVCFAAAVLFLAWPHWLKESFNAGADVLFTDLVILLLLLVISARERPVFMVAAGAALGVAYTVKPAALFLALPLAVLFWLDSSNLTPARRLAWLMALLGTALLFASPMLARNYLLFGDPVYSTNICTAGHIGSDDSGQALMHVYWGEPLPSLGRWVRVTGLGGVATKLLHEVGRAAAALFGGLGFFFVIPSLLVVVGASYNRRARRLWAFLGLFVLEMVVLWVVWPRLLLPVVPVVTLTGAVGGLLIAQRLFSLPRRTTVAFVLTIALVAGSGIAGYGWWRLEQPRRTSALAAHVAAAKWMKMHLPPQAVVMSHYPYVVRFHSDRPVVQIPFDSADRIREVMGHYGVDTIISPPVGLGPRWASSLPRHALLAVVEQEGWECVYGNGVRVFRRGSSSG